MTGLFERLKAGCPDEWQAYTRHPFIEGMADGTLPDAAFAHYLKQDYLFLVQFARAYSLAGYKARTLRDLRRAKDGVAVLLDVELGLHVSFCKKWGITEADLENLPEATATMAYTRYVLECGLAGDLLDLHVAMSPCMLGYGEIGQALAPDNSPDNPYAEWINMYSSEDYLAACAEQKSYLDYLAGDDVSPRRFEQLLHIFNQATRLEINFWQMGLDLAL